MFKKNTAVAGFPIGHFIQTADGAAKTTGTPTCKRLLDGTAGTLTNAAAYDATAGVWKIDLAAGDMNGDMVGLVFALADCIPISYAIRTTTKLVSDLNDSAYAGGAVASVTGNVGGNVTGSVGSVAAGGITAASIAQNAIDADALATDAIDEIIAAILAMVYEGSQTFQSYLRLTRAVHLGKSSGGGSVYRDAADTKARVTATIDGASNRTAVTTDAT